jgi:hypothetical protein
MILNTLKSPFKVTSVNNYTLYRTCSTPMLRPVPPADPKSLLPRDSMMSISPLVGHPPYELSLGIIQIAAKMIYFHKSAFFGGEFYTRPNPISGWDPGARLHLSVGEAEGVDGVETGGGGGVQNVLGIASAHATPVPILGAAANVYF